ncbi:putative insecticidal toxin complex protein [Proteus hauseri ATCC 700826]|uniref:Insecticidal toxin complex protein n=1 Tax=Proteus hauseri ATCC 700826 TaxID=1354271 RepID=A0AAJ3LSE1_PROHU|nr:RHS repeat-associated core domain-containing protein [Proteus hauseri]OAT44926.1 putative insecticidal toxin complex protein [Proteus hauseri ATCC 700826]
MSNQQLHTRTPTVVVLDNRGSTIREINYCRHPDAINQTDERITRHQYHARGYLQQSIDARLHEIQQSDATIQSNIQQTISLGGALSLSQGVDNGISFNLNDIEGTISQQINEKETVTTYKYSDKRFVRYLKQVEEGTLINSDTVVIQKLMWGANDEKYIANNQIGKCIEHLDTAGRKTVDSFSLLGAVLSEAQQLHYGSYINWDLNNEINSIEEKEKRTTQYIYDATGMVLTETDCEGHQRRIHYDIAGFIKQSWLTLKGQSEQTILRSLSYSAAGQKLREEHGNGLVTTYEYEPETQRLLHVKTERPQGHVLGAKLMQDLRYEYDPVGNIVCVKNDAEATRYWRNQKIVPENRYIYDSLYQLVSASGRETANQQTPASMQSQPVTTLVKDVQSYTNYTRLYTYDRGGNLTQIRHNSPTAQQSFTQDIIVSSKTNRALLKSQCSDPHQIDNYFDESGNLTKLLNGENIIWDSRNHLKATNDVIEGGYLYEGETYQYNSAGQRITKLRGRKISYGNLEKVTTHYLPNIEIWEVNEDPVTEKYAVVQINAGTSAKVRALCWEIGTPKGIENNALRYSYDDGVGNSGLETDGQGQLVSYEEYYPYGGTAIWSSENAVEANYKTIRYSGKEKDSTGMYYYGYRYYQPWIGRWLSADPAGTIDGLNLYRMVRNNTVTLHDPDGRAPIPPAPPMAPPAPPMAPPAPPMAPPAPPPIMGGAPLAPSAPGNMPPPFPSAQPQAVGKKKWEIKADPALWKQQGGEYPYYSSFTITLQKLGIEHFSNISDMDTFVKKWTEIGQNMKPAARDIDHDKAIEVQKILGKIDTEWSGYKKATVSETFRGDTPVVSNSYSWLSGFIKESEGKAEAISKEMNLDIKSSLIMSTAKDPKMGYVSGKSIMWHFNLDEGHAGVSEGLYASEGEVTFPIYNKMKITSLQYLPKGSSYMNNPERFGTSHRYIINANMLSK